MLKINKPAFSLLALYFVCMGISHAAPNNFNEAKHQLRKVYDDHPETLYCGCDLTWNKSKGTSGTIDLASCGYTVRKNENRALRVEAEHIVPAHSLGQFRQCWQNGGRKNCTATDPVFSAMEADLHNLAPAIGEVNGDRSNFRLSVVSGTAKRYGACPMKIDFKNRIAEPPDAVKGLVARVYFYMADHYGFNLSKQHQHVLKIWDKQFPPDAWEIERDNRIALVMGHHNPFVTGEKQWQ